MSTTNTFMVRTVGAGRVREGRILATSKSAACQRAIDKHREALLDTAGNDRTKFLAARTASILVSTVETITFKVGDVLGGGEAA